MTLNELFARFDKLAAVRMQSHVCILCGIIFLLTLTLWYGNMFTSVCFENYVNK